MSSRRGDSDFALQEGGNPPPCPLMFVWHKTYQGHQRRKHLPHGSRRGEEMGCADVGRRRTVVCVENDVEQDRQEEEVGKRRIGKVSRECGLHMSLAHLFCVSPRRQIELSYRWLGYLLRIYMPCYFFLQKLFA